MRLELLKAYPNLLNVHSKYAGSSSIYVMKAGWVTLSAWHRLDVAGATRKGAKLGISL